jgi:hypothetical protein
MNSGEKTLENTEGPINELTFQRKWQQTKKNKPKTAHNMSWTPLFTSKHK